MEWKVLLATFTAVFLAELADKTQIVGITMSAKSGRPLSVWIGSVAAYAIVTLISVFLGAILARYLKPELIKYAGASLFVVIGILMLAGKI
ncbi:MAG: TMEM165/GDT1 family protein [Candidatus Omnitrophota bacterium]|jgi:putative Ca2+/H+ antiporter (TMEM165/GDT1 family)